MIKVDKTKNKIDEFKKKKKEKRSIDETHSIMVHYQACTLLIKWRIRVGHTYLCRDSYTILIGEVFNSKKIFVGFLKILTQ